MPKLKEVTVTYDRKQSWQTQAGNWSSMHIDFSATVTPDKGESDSAAALKATAFCRNHVLVEMCGAFPALRQKIDGLPLDLDAIEAMQTIASLPENVQQALVEAGIDPDRFIYHMLPENVEVAFNPQ